MHTIVNKSKKINPNLFSLTVTVLVDPFEISPKRKKAE